ncbi:protein MICRORCHIDIA 6-like [Oryza brachyantha]|uniref:protein MICRORCHIDIA 6-like n=1 Tax=Oryza brachyantha TaxID=4533 RepID=UPI00077679AF|nr:protein MICRORCHIDIA 6-like [Oryza brachyantha]
MNSMGTEEDTKPFVSPITSAPQCLRGFSTCQAPPLERVARRAAEHEQQGPCVLNQAATELPEECATGRSRSGESLEEGTSAAAPSRAAARISRRFWSAGEYEAAGGRSSPQPPPRNVQNRMCVHPKFLHSNATSHKWPFGAVAELLDNAVDEIKNGAKKIIVDKVVNNRDGSPALLVQDDGGGMNPDSLRSCMSFGFSDKQSGSSIGQYGNGFKTSTMRLGADVIVFSRSMKNSEPTQSIGLLSYTFLTETGQKDVIVPVVDYMCNLSTGEAKPYHRLGPDQFSSNLSILLKWSPFATEEQLMHNFSDIGPHGTKILVFNLWSDDDGDLELDFDTNVGDIRISGAPKPVETTNVTKRMNESHLANQLRYSLRDYVSILYLQLPGYFKIILRGQEVMHHYVASDLRYSQCISYKPQVFGTNEDQVLTTIGFLDGAPTISVHGFSIYHKNRLILPFHRVLSSASSKGRGVAGVLEVDFIKPTHDKQDFEKSQLYQKLITRLKNMTNEYWDLYSHLVGYHKVPRAASGSPASRALVPTMPSTTAKPSEPNPNDHLPPMVPSRPNSCDKPSNAIPIAFAPPASAPAGTNIAATRAPTVCSELDMQIIQGYQTRSPTVAACTDLADTRKRKMETPLQMDGPFKRQSTSDLAGNNSVDSSNEICQYMGERELNEFSYLKLEQNMLRQQCLELESTERDLLLKEHQLRLEIQQAEARYTGLLNEYISVAAVSTRK